VARFRLRNLWRTLHLWIGLCLFVVLAPLGLSGSLLVFDDSLDHLLHPVRYAVSSAPATPSAAAYIVAARAAFGDRPYPTSCACPQRPASRSRSSARRGRPAR